MVSKVHIAKWLFFSLTFNYCVKFQKNVKITSGEKLNLQKLALALQDEPIKRKWGTAQSKMLTIKPPLHPLSKSIENYSEEDR